MHNHRRLLLDKGVDQHGDTREDEWDTKPLSHVEYHIVLESHLRLLDELDEETHSEASDEECADEESAMEFRKSVLVHKYLENTQEEITQGFI
jgi:hypothetical protein